MSLFDGFKFRTISSPIHRLDPRAKFLYVCVLFIAAAIFNELLPLTLLFFVQFPLIFMAKVQREWIRSLKGASLFAIIIFATNFVSAYLRPGSLIGVVPPIDTTIEYILLFERSIAVTLL